MLPRGSFPQQRRNAPPSRESEDSRRLGSSSQRTLAPRPASKDGQVRRPRYVADTARFREGTSLALLEAVEAGSAPSDSSQRSPGNFMRPGEEADGAGLLVDEEGDQEGGEAEEGLVLVKARSKTLVPPNTPAGAAAAVVERQAGVCTQRDKIKDRDPSLYFNLQAQEYLPVPPGYRKTTLNRLEKIENLGGFDRLCGGSRFSPSSTFKDATRASKTSSNDDPFIVHEGSRTSDNTGRKAVATDFQPLQPPSMRKYSSMATIRSPRGNTFTDDPRLLQQATSASQSAGDPKHAMQQPLDISPSVMSLEPEILHHPLRTKASNMTTATSTSKFAGKLERMKPGHRYRTTPPTKRNPFHVTKNVNTGLPISPEIAGEAAWKQGVKYARKQNKEFAKEVKLREKLSMNEFRDMQKQASRHPLRKEPSKWSLFSRNKSQETFGTSSNSLHSTACESSVGLGITGFDDAPPVPTIPTNYLHTHGRVLPTAVTPTHGKETTIEDNKDFDYSRTADHTLNEYYHQNHRDFTEYNDQKGTSNQIQRKCVDDADSINVEEGSQAAQSGAASSDLSDTSFERTINRMNKHFSLHLASFGKPEDLDKAMEKYAQREADSNRPRKRSLTANVAVDAEVNEEDDISSANRVAMSPAPLKIRNIKGGSPEDLTPNKVEAARIQESVRLLKTPIVHQEDGLSRDEIRRRRAAIVQNYLAQTPHSVSGTHPALRTQAEPSTAGATWSPGQNAILKGKGLAFGSIEDVPSQPALSFPTSTPTAYVAAEYESASKRHPSVALESHQYRNIGQMQTSLRQMVMHSVDDFNNDTPYSNQFVPRSYSTADLGMKPSPPHLHDAKVAGQSKSPEQTVPPSIPGRSFTVPITQGEFGSHSPLDKLLQENLDA
ncbi:hypothetical protein K431DRAFT_302818 [Polychaeton citri CBS 116435]|uniref:Uncharacterized protein n=1 Tax=Polychaeton citri CBS 116435 TaxID=1314669 RepID=A0A9P4Q9D5_9PEZI|nr:hypothetical protein K431DRAFT_302818 [Polychaeton citri CBS 116435]